MAYSDDFDSDSDLMSLTDDDRSDDESLVEAGLAARCSSQRLGSGNHLGQTSAASQAAKAIQVADERNALPEPSESTDNVLLFPLFSANRQDHTHTQVLDAGPAPPDYLAATTSNPGSTWRERGWNDRTPYFMSDFSAPSYQGALSASAQPWRYRAEPLRDSLGRIARTLWKYARSGREGRNSRRPITGRRYCNAFIFFIALFLFGVITTFMLLRSRTSRDRSQNLPEMVEISLDAFADKHVITDSCSFDTFYEVVDIPFEEVPNDFQLDERIDLNCGRDFSNCSVSGNVEIITVSMEDRAEVLGDVPMLIRVSLATSNFVPFQGVNYNKDRNWVDLYTPIPAGNESTPLLSRRGESTATACMDFWVGVYVREDVELTNWATQLRYLNFVDKGTDAYGVVPPRIRDGFATTVNVKNVSRISSDSGEIHVDYWDSRETYFKTRTGNISGRFAFRDVLNLESWSGNVDALVQPHNNASSWWGQNETRSLATVTRSGNTAVLVRPPPAMHFADDCERERYFPHRVESKHETTTGSLDVDYPEVWEGVVRGMSVFGDIDLKGKDFEHWSTIQGKSAEVNGKKGFLVRASADIKFATETGDVRIRIGEESREPCEILYCSG